MNTLYSRAQAGSYVKVTRDHCTPR